MNATSSKFSVQPEQVAYWVSMAFLVGMCIFFLIDRSVVLMEYGIYSLTSTGVLGMLSAFAFGWYASKKGRPQKSFAGHSVFSFVFTLATTVLYFAAFTMAKWMAG